MLCNILTMWSWSACRRLVDTQKRLSAQEAHFIKEKEDAASTIAGMQQDMDRSARCINTLESVRLTAHVQAQRWKCQIGCWFWEVGSVHLCGCRSCDHTYSWKAKVEDLLAKYQPFCVSWLYPIAFSHHYCYYTQEQLEAFDALKSESSFAQAEVSLCTEKSCMPPDCGVCTFSFYVWVPTTLNC